MTAKKKWKEMLNMAKYMARHVFVDGYSVQAEPPENKKINE